MQKGVTAVNTNELDSQSHSQSAQDIDHDDRLQQKELQFPAKLPTWLISRIHLTHSCQTICSSLQAPTRALPYGRGSVIVDMDHHHINVDVFTMLQRMKRNCSAPMLAGYPCTAPLSLLLPHSGPQFHGNPAKINDFACLA
jgi:hypothetical protein